MEQLNKARIIEELNAIASTKATDYMTRNEKGEVMFKPSCDLTREQSAAISGIKATRHGNVMELVEITLHNGQKVRKTWDPGLRGSVRGHKGVIA